LSKLRRRKRFYATSRDCISALAIRLSTSNRRFMARNEDDFRIRPGKVRDRGGGQEAGRRIGAARGRPTSFVGEVHRAIRRAGGNPNRDPGTGKGGGCFNARGRGAATALSLKDRSAWSRDGSGARTRARRVAVKARVVKLNPQRGAARGRQFVSAKAVDAHLRYLERDGVTKDGEKGQVYSGERDVEDGRAFLDRGRDDRHQSRFPVEILGVAAGIALPSVPREHQEWLANTILRGMTQGQFRTPLSRLAAHVALATVDDAASGKQQVPSLDVGTLGIADLTLAAAIHLGFMAPVASDAAAVEQALLSRAFTQPIPINDAAEAAALAVLARRATDQIVLGSPETTPEDRIVALCRRFPLFVDRLQVRQRGRAPLAVKDEYDVQDLLHAVLTLHFDDVRPEEFTPSYAGNASRVDFYLPRERIIVEAKMTRNNLSQKEVANELVIDAARYAQMPTVDTLICVVYDPERKCANPRTLENDVEASAGRLKVRAVVCPQGL